MQALKGYPPGAGNLLPEDNGPQAWVAGEFSLGPFEKWHKTRDSLAWIVPSLCA